MPTHDFAEPAWRDYGQVIVVDDLDEAFAVADAFAAEHVQVLTANPRQALDDDAQLRRAVPRREHLRLLRRQGDRHQPRAADPGRGPLHRRPLGRASTSRPSPTRRSPTRPSSARAGRALRSGRRGSSCSRVTPAPATCGPAKFAGRPHDWRATRRDLEPARRRSAEPIAATGLWPDARRSSPAAATVSARPIARALHGAGARWSSPGARAEPLETVAGGRAAAGRRARRAATSPTRRRSTRWRRSLADEDDLDPGQQRRHRRPGGPADRDRRRRLGRGVRHQRARCLPDLPGVPAGHGRTRHAAT